MRLISKFLFKDGGGRAAHDPGQDRRQAVRHLRRRRRIRRLATAPRRLQAACAAGLPPFPMARIIDISDETKPKLVSQADAGDARSRQLRQGAPRHRRTRRSSRTAATTAASTTSRTRPRWRAATSTPASASSTFAIRPTEGNRLLQSRRHDDARARARITSRRVNGAPAGRTGARRRCISTPTAERCGRRARTTAC